MKKTIITFGFIILGVFGYLGYSTNVFVDKQGIVHELFFLLPISLFSIFLGLVLFLSTAITRLIKKNKLKRKL